MKNENTWRREKKQHLHTKPVALKGVHYFARAILSREYRSHYGIRTFLNSSITGIYFYRAKKIKKVLMRRKICCDFAYWLQGTS